MSDCRMICSTFLLQCRNISSLISLLYFELAFILSSLSKKLIKMPKTKKRESPYLTKHCAESQLFRSAFEAAGLSVDFFKFKIIICFELKKHLQVQVSLTEPFLNEKIPV